MKFLDSADQKFRKDDLSLITESGPSPGKTNKWVLESPENFFSLVFGTWAMMKAGLS